MWKLGAASNFNNGQNKVGLQNKYESHEQMSISTCIYFKIKGFFRPGFNLYCKIVKHIDTLDVMENSIFSNLLWTCKSISLISVSLSLISIGRFSITEIYIHRH